LSCQGCGEVRGAAAARRSLAAAYVISVPGRAGPGTAQGTL